MQAAAVCSGSGFAPLWQKGHALRHDFVLATFLAVFCLPAALLKPPIDNHPVAFAEVLPAVFRLLAEHDDIDEADFFLEFITLLEAPARRQAEARDRRSAGCVPQFRIPSQISDQNDFIEPRQRSLLVRLVLPQVRPWAEQAPAPISP